MSRLERVLRRWLHCRGILPSPSLDILGVPFGTRRRRMELDD